MKKKCLITTGLVVALTLSSVFSSFAEWKQDENGWWWEEDDGSYPVNTWKEVNGKHYYFDLNGYMLSDTITPDGYKVGVDGDWIQENTSIQSQAYILQTVFDDMKLSFSELNQKYGGYEIDSLRDASNNWDIFADEEQGKSVSYANAANAIIFIPDNGGLNTKALSNYYFKTDGGDIAADAKLYALKMESKDTFFGFEKEYKAQDLVNLFNSMGATECKLLDKNFSHKYIHLNGTTENVGWHPTELRVKLNDCYFYFSGRDGMLRIDSIIRVFSVPNKYYDRVFDESQYTKTTRETKAIFY